MISRTIVVSLSLLSPLILGHAVVEGCHTCTENQSAQTKTKSQKQLEQERLLKERRANALSLLISLAADARNFKDQRLRARTLARIADALWIVDPERARVMFRSAWNDAVTADKESQQHIQDDISQTQAKSGGGYAVPTPKEIRSEVLRLAAKRERSLGEEFIGKLKEDKDVESGDAKDHNVFRSEAAGDTYRLELAQSLLAEGDINRALQFAVPLLGDVTIASMDFLASLREKDLAAADQRYTTLVASSATNPQSDANTVSLLSSYIFTPHFFLTFNGTAISSAETGSIAPVVLSDELRAAFFQAAGAILLRPLVSGSESPMATDIDATYLVIRRLLPLFEQYAPQQTTIALRTQLAALESMVTPGARRENDFLNHGLGPERPAPDLEKTLLDQIERARTSAERDRLYLRLANYLAGSGDMRARDYADKIDESELRNAASAFIDASIALRAVEKKDTDRAQEIARIGNLTHIQKAWVLPATAKLLAQNDRDKALFILNSAMDEARRIDVSDPDRARGLFAVTSVMFAIDRTAAWNIANEAIKSSNPAEQFTGEDGEIVLRLTSKGYMAVDQKPIPEFDVAPLFSQLAAENYERAVELAGVFTHEAPRANAVIAIAQTVLSEKGNDKTTTPPKKRQKPKPISVIATMFDASSRCPSEVSTVSSNH